MTAPNNGSNSNNGSPEPEYEADGAILHNLMLFGEVLRCLGLDFGSGNMLDLVRATEQISIGKKQDFRHAARALLVHRKQDLDGAWRHGQRRSSHHDELHQCSNSSVAQRSRSCPVRS